VWLDVGGHQVSALDLCGPGFTLLAGADAARWRSAAEQIRAGTGLKVAVHEIGPAAELADPDGSWPEQVALAAGGAVLVRPDQHVAARSDGGLTPDSLLPILETLLGRVGSAAGQDPVT
jgi:hypothetical protein